MGGKTQPMPPVNYVHVTNSSFVYSEPTKGYATVPTVHQTHRCLSKPMLAAIPWVTKRIYASIHNTVAMPQISADRLFDMFVSPEDQAALRRATKLARGRLVYNQTLGANVMAHSNDGFHVVVRYHITNYPVILPDGRDEKLIINKDCDEYQDMRAYVENAYIAEFKTAHYLAFVMYLSYACQSANELKLLWPTFVEPFRGNNDPGVQSFIRKFDKAKKATYVPQTFIGIGQQIEEAERTAALMLALGEIREAGSTDPDVTFDSSNRVRPKISVPWAEAIKPWMENAYTTMPFGSDS